ncbi:hypothetical protein FA15DRAFT_731168 [Coprinopsis marcescibilis]|uniref:Uncharacterized protein n=1 Tax=Coprinopsis marcescibilis TaxID=230819 RepID=A0A5C3L0X7_COPMA|nr:hypothetical protein FA15DRAFT_731168 [Coprinopsis marcescibilis]
MPMSAVQPKSPTLWKPMFAMVQTPDRNIYAFDPATANSSNGRRTATSGLTGRGALDSLEPQKKAHPCCSFEFCSASTTMADPHLHSSLPPHLCLNNHRRHDQLVIKHNPRNNQMSTWNAPVQETVTVFHDPLNLVQKVIYRTDEMHTEFNAFRTAMTARIEALKNQGSR